MRATRRRPQASSPARVPAKPGLTIPTETTMMGRPHQSRQIRQPLSTGWRDRVLLCATRACWGCQPACSVRQVAQFGMPAGLDPAGRGGAFRAVTPRADHGQLHGGPPTTEGTSESPTHNLARSGDARGETSGRTRSRRRIAATPPTEDAMSPDMATSGVPGRERAVGGGRWAVGPAWSGRAMRGRPCRPAHDRSSRATVWCGWSW